MSDFDINGARKAGYTDAEIADHLAKSRSFDTAGARKAGYSDADIISHLSGAAAPAAPAQAQGGPTAGGVQDWEPQGYTEGQKAARIVGSGAQGFNDAVAGTVGAPVDAAAWLMRQAGMKTDKPVGGSESIKAGLDYVATLPGRVSDAVTQRSLSPLADDRTSRFEPVTQGEKISRGVGEGVGNALSVVVPAAAIAGTARAGTVGQGIANTLATQPVTQTVAGAVGGAVTGATDNPWLGLAAGAAVPLAASVARGVISPVTNRLTPQEQRLVAGAQAEGITLTPAQQTGSPSLRGLEETMARMPLSNTPMQNAFAGQRQQFNQAVMQRAGQTANDASPDTMQRAFTGLGQVFDDLATRTTVNVDQRFGTDVQRVAANYGRRLETDVAPVFQSYLDDLAPLVQAANAGQSPQLAGDVYRTIRSDITTRMRESSNLPLRRALGGLVESLDDVMERSTSGALRNEWQEARRHYASLMTIDKAVSGGTQAGRAAGDVPFNSLSSAVKASDKTGYSRGRGDLNELARIGDYLAARIPNSGTPERAGWQNMLTGGALFGGGMASGIGVPAAAAATALPWAASRFYNSAPGRAYLTNQLAGNTNFNALYGGMAAQQGLEQVRGGPNALRVAR
ncbi:hypothetical protein [uncultured Bradyrhizobium sp.]|uniref:hypothetical protein n=1 Tax=uncultured Bradyrhizobium sp. TaxID=199684 RepID=UPI0026110112|nr:hypothetical protein [uncultured Bradyrhizobium sp.]